MEYSLEKRSPNQSLVSRTAADVETFAQETVKSEQLVRSLVKLQDEPDSLSDLEFKLIFDALIKNPKYLHVLTLRLFDSNNEAILNDSESTIGFIGRLNRYSRRRRRKRYFKKINDGFKGLEYQQKHLLPGQQPKVILAEGDSWFEYPLVVTDIVDWLSKRDHYAVYSMASAGDWLSNMMYSGEYVEALPIHNPDVLLVSGGGNDMVGGNRLALMLKDYKERNVGPGINWFGTTNHPDRRIMNGRSFIKEEFLTFLNLLKLQYLILFSNVRAKYKNLKIITHGYDFAIPTRKINWSFGLQPFVNIKTDHGKWLRQSFMLRGIVDEEEQKNTVRAMIDEYNEMMIGLINSASQFEVDGEGLTNIHHIDLRGVVGDDGWYDEMHPNSKAFERIADAYAACIDTENHDEEPGHEHNGVPIYSC